MANQETIYTVADRVATITLNRPDKLNAWTATMEQEVRAAMYEAERDAECPRDYSDRRGTRILRGCRHVAAGRDRATGPGRHRVRRASCATPDNGERQNVRPDFQKKYSYFPSIQKPVIAAVNGPAVGLGFIISLYCDLRFASDTARFGTAFAKRGLIAEYGLAWMLPRLIGPANALDMLFSARLVDANEALTDGTGESGVSRRIALWTACTLTRRIWPITSARGRCASSKIKSTTRCFKRCPKHLRQSEQEMVESLQCEDFKEGVAHFLEKRAAAFTGK